MRTASVLLAVLILASCGSDGNSSTVAGNEPSGNESSRSEARATIGDTEYNLPIQSFRFEEDSNYVSIDFFTSIEDMATGLRVTLVIYLEDLNKGLVLDNVGKTTLNFGNVPGLRGGGITQHDVKRGIKSLDGNPAHGGNVQLGFDWEHNSLAFRASVSGKLQ